MCTELDNRVVLLVSRQLFLIAPCFGFAIVTHVTLRLGVRLGTPRIPVSPEKTAKAPTTFHKYIMSVSDSARIRNRPFCTKRKDTGINSFSRSAKSIFNQYPDVNNARNPKQKKIRSMANSSWQYGITNWSLCVD